MADSKEETFLFNADIQQLMSLIINTFYSNKDVFLRELISNASDALDKIRHESLTDPAALGDNKDLYVRIIPDKTNNTLTIRDTGIGMTKMDLVNNLGTIARSGTKQFMEAIQGGGDASMIGQFGVGFYSAYLVADKVVVVTKNNKDEQYIWQSSAGSSFTVDRDITGERLGRGTAVILHMKEDQLEYLEERRIEELIKRHSAFIPFSIKLAVQKQVEKEITDTDSDDGKVDDLKMDEDKDETDDKKEVINDKKEEEDIGQDNEDDQKTDIVQSKEKPKKKITEVKVEDQLLNPNEPLWLRNPSEVSKEEYARFYKYLTNAWEDHLAVKHFSVEGSLEFKCIIFVPCRPPYELFDNTKKHHNMKLYVRRVLVKDDCEDLIPEWLKFIQGVIDSNDLPINISREALQQNRIIRLMRRTIVRKSIELFEEIAETPDFKQFHENFSIQLRYGIHDDSASREKLADLVRYKSSKTSLTDSDDLVSFVQYKSRMQPNQKYIYFITGHALEAVAYSPCIEELKHRNIEVLFMVEPIDEYVVQQLKSYNNIELRSCTKSTFDLELSDEEKKEKEALDAEFQPFCTFINEVLSSTPDSSTLEKVCCSRRLRQSAVVIVTGNYGWSGNMERIARSQALRDKQHTEYMKSRKTFEINPINPIIKELKRRFDVDKSDKTIKDLIILLYQSALLQSGFIPDNPNEYASKVYRMIHLGLSVDDDEDQQMPSLDESVEGGISDNFGDENGPEVSKMEEVD